MKHVQKMDVTNYDPNTDVEMVAISYDEPDTVSAPSNESSKKTRFIFDADGDLHHTNCVNCGH